MSAKRSATSELNADNWNDELEVEEKGVFQTASSDELKNRVIRKARRKLTNSDEKPLGESSSGIFGSFTGFGKIVSSASTVTSSPFSFLSNTTSSASFSKNTDSGEKETKILENGNKSNGGVDKSNDYCNKLKNLNKSVLNWIQTHVDKNPICILSPIFADYEKHLKEIEENNSKSNNKSDSTDLQTKQKSVDSFKQFKFSPSSENTGFKTDSLFTSPSGVKANTIPEKVATDSNASSSKPMFSFGVKPEPSPVSSGFSFGDSAAKFSFTNTNAPFSFGSFAKPADSNENKNNANENNEGEEDYKPPKADFVPVVEEDSIYSKKCKVFVKSDENFADRGVGTLYLKPVKDQKRTQLLVRADTNLGNVLLNIILNDTIPTRRMGKNNVLIVCCLPESENKPTQILIRVKTGDEADELLEIIDKHKVDDN